MRILQIQKKAVVVILCTAGGLNAAYADEWSVAVNVGKASTDMANVTLPPELGQNVSQQVNDDDTGVGFEIAYAFTPTLRAALGYVDFGEGEFVISADSLTPEAFAQSVQRAPVLASGITATAQYQVFNQNDFFVDLELGLFRWSADISSTSSLGTVRRDDDSVDIVWGANVGYALTPQWHLRAGYKSYELEERIDFPHVGVTYHF